uniref:Costars domain-containing protein n=1 Tax=Denticeps clupeoides TaxID=299321 RepID=A0AAY4E7V4_9TELE
MNEDIGRSGGDGRPAVDFGTLFERYVTISDKLVGVLLRARKQGLVHFEGEMLWQGRDDHVVITLLQLHA